MIIQSIGAPPPNPRILCRKSAFVITFQVTRSVQAKRDTACALASPSGDQGKSSIINEFWMPALVPSSNLQVIRVCAGMTTFTVIPLLRHSFPPGGGQEKDKYGFN